MAKSESPVIVSFWTSNWQYKEKARSLHQDCIKYDLEHWFSELPDTGHYLSNTRMKPQFIRDMLDKFPQIVWLDADSAIRKDPILLKQPIKGDCMLVRNTTMPRHWHVGITAWRRTDCAIAYLDEWIRQTRDAPTDDNAFERAWIASQGGGLDVQVLPHEYHVFPHQKVDPVISIGISKDPTKMENKRNERRMHLAAQRGRIHA